MTDECKNIVQCSRLAWQRMPYDITCMDGRWTQGACGVQFPATQSYHVMTLTQASLLLSAALSPWHRPRFSPGYCNND